MKNQYVGDIGDYGKYALLRTFISEGIKVGINWYLTDNDDSKDGKFTDYLKKNELEKYDPELFAKLQVIVNKGNKKSIEDIQNSGLLKDTLFYDEIIDSNDREKWFAKSVDCLSDAELIFMDPDNGLSTSDNANKGTLRKYALPAEVNKYYENGHNVVYYCHKGRRTDSEWREYKSYMLEHLDDVMPVILTYHRGTQRSYVFLVHPEDFTRYERIKEKFMLKCGRKHFFTEEYATRKDVSDTRIVPNNTMADSVMDYLTVHTCL